VLALCLLYVAIGRDMVALLGAKTGAVEMEVARETQRVTHDIERIAGLGLETSASELDSPLAFNSAAALAEKESVDVDAWLHERPIEPTSRVR
jgi:hypothetical protein